MTVEVIYYDEDIFYSDDYFQVHKAFGYDYICMLDLDIGHRCYDLNKLDNPNRYRWYWYDLMMIYVRLDYKELIFDKIIKLDCVEDFIMREEL